MSTTNLEDTFENACVVCFKNVEIFSIGDCDHPVCYECSTRMRVLCRQNECPICRHDMTKVVFTYNVRPFKELRNGTYLMDKKFQICFDSPEIQRAYNTLLAHVCSRCQSRHAFQNFNSLRDHMRREHELHYCDLCVDNLKILTCERRCYTRQELAQHRRRGDPDDKSHKGHPLCEFCDKRYMDNDELYRHLRRDHLFCHFCDTDGLHQYYSSYDFLREHFRKEHYLCEEGGCYEEKFIAVFRTEIDIKAHRASVHGRTIGKAAAKQARTLELEFTLAPRPRDGRDRGRGGQRNLRMRPEFREEEEGAVGGMYIDCHTTPQYMNPPASQINTDCIDEFPSLGGNTASTTHRAQSRKTSGLTIRAGVQGGLAVTDENFPALGPEATLSLRVNSSSSGERPISSIVTSKPTNVSIHLNHRPSSGVSSGVVTTRVSSSQNVRLKEKDPFPTLSDQFPALPNSKMSSAVASTAATQWSSGKESESKLSLVKNKLPSQPPPKPPQPKTFHIEDDFPSLSTRFDAGCSVKQDFKQPDTKYKKASISIPVADSWLSVAKESNNGNISSDSDIGNKKSSKKKKKKPGTKNASSSNNSSGNETKPNTATKKGNNKANVEKDKKKKQKDDTNKIEVEKKRQENQENEKPESILTERKRSELVIGKLVKQSQLQPETKMDVNDFPVLGKSRPPGFSEVSKAPPGFESTDLKSAPPPGFSITLNSVARPPSNGLTFTSSSGQTYPITPGSSIPSSAYSIYSYVPPANFNQRNGDLVDRVVAALKDPSELDEFRQMSSAFRQSLINAKGYYDHCQRVMGASTFLDIFPELIVLLPDIEKQQELWSVYQTTDRPKSSIKLDVCATCCQVISTSDLRHHVMSHTLENHFPALANGVVQTNNAWVKK